MDENRRRSGQIPAFGDWDYTNDMPITQYFECARQAGLIRHSSSSGDSTDPCVGGDLYAVHFKKPSRTTVLSPPRKKRGKERRYEPHVKKEQKRVGKVCDVTEPARKPGRQHTNHAVPPPLRVISADVRPPKPVDEDLYEIPPELQYTSKQKRGKERRYEPHVKKEQKRVGKVCDVTEPARKPGRQHTNHAVPPPLRVISADVRPPKPVDEDLYEIPPELHTSKQKKKLGFFSRCLVPACAA